VKTWREIPGAVLFAVMVLGCAGTSPTSGPGLPPEIDPRDPLAPTMLMQQGQALVSEGRVDAGMERYRAALRLQPGNPTIHNLIGVAELRREQAVKALESFNRALSIAPNYSDARNNRGAAYVQLGQLALAEADFLAVLADTTYANRSGLFFNLGSLYLQRGQINPAEENLRRATQGAAPPEAFLLLADVQERQGKVEPAEASLREALSRAPERAEIALGLARFLERQKRLAEAREYYQRVIALDSDSEAARQARASLER